MILLLKAYAAEFVEGFNVAIVELSDDLKKLVLDRRELFQMVHGKAPDLMRLTFWNSAPEFYGDSILYDEDGDSLLTEEEEDFFDKNEHLELSKERCDELTKDATCMASECERLVLTDDSFGWRVSPKHTDGGWAETVSLSYDMLVSQVGEIMQNAKGEEPR